MPVAALSVGTVTVLNSTVPRDVEVPGVIHGHLARREVFSKPERSF